MSWTLLGIGAAAVYLLQDDDPDHDDVVEATYDLLEEKTAGDSKVFADHLSHRDDIENPDGEVAGLSKIPDVVVRGGVDNSLLIEVETKDSLGNKTNDALEQLHDFSKLGYRRVLVVPAAHEDAGRAFIKEYGSQLSGPYYLAVPKKVPELL